MPASDVRKDKRKRARDDSLNLSKSLTSQPVKPKKMKFGRKEIRTVTRTSRRSGPDDEGEEEEDENNEEDDYDYEENGNASDGATNKDEHPNENNMAYSALLTLLKNDHPDAKPRKEKKQKNIEEYEEEDSDDEKLDEINDVESDEENEEDIMISKEEMIEDDNDYNNQFDAFNLHFNDESKIEKVIDEYELKSEENKKLLKLNNRVRFDDVDYIKLDYQFDLTNNTKKENNSKLKTLKSKLKYHNVKQKIEKKFGELDPKNELELELIESLLTYQNINFQNYLLPKSSSDNYQDYYLLHCLNHVFKTADRILNNNEKKKQVLKKIESGELKPEEEPEFRDQGYTRPKVLILLPTRNAAWEIVNKLIKFSSLESVENKSKFKDQYYDSFNVDELNSRKPDDFKEFFKGNSNDFFCLGIKLTRKAFKLFSQFEQADIIVASPLGLKMILEKSKNDSNTHHTEDKMKRRKDAKEPVKKIRRRDQTVDFLSSIEITVLDKSDGLIMQNWDHVNEILTKYLNQPPKNFDNLKLDFSRIRMWSINDRYKYISQMITFSKYSTPELNNLIMNNSKISINLLNGSTIFKPIITDSNNEINSFKLKLIKMGLINNNMRLKQIFMRFEMDSIIDEPNDRFKFFKNVTLPQIQSKLSYENGTLIYIPSYIDYIRIKNYLKQSSVSFVAIDEYSTQGQITRNRDFFGKGYNNAKIMLYTERLHFYKRYDIKGVKNVVFYGLPSDPNFYSQVLNFIVDNKIRIDLNNSKLQLRIDSEKKDEPLDEIDLNLCIVRIMFSKLDILKLEKIVGLKNAGVLVNGVNEMNEFN